jgi:catechol 2,3-dioxygenase-like lactoylglutathione lyase family enzyme
MAVTLNHTIVAARDKRESATFLSEMLGLPEPVAFGSFLVVEAANGVSLDFRDAEEGFEIQHYAFLVSEQEFDEIFGRILGRGVPYSADPFGREPGQINHHDRGRGVYWRDPGGHVLEIITRPYGGA